MRIDSKLISDANGKMPGLLGHAAPDRRVAGAGPVRPEPDSAGRVPVPRRPQHWASADERPASGERLATPRSNYMHYNFIGGYARSRRGCWESWRLIDDRAHLAAGANLVGSVGVGLVAVFADLVVGRALQCPSRGRDYWSAHLHPRPVARGIAEATVVRDIEGYGARAHLDTSRILGSPLVEVVDQEDRLRPILPELDAMVSDGLITLARVDVIAHRPEGTGSN